MNGNEVTEKMRDLKLKVCYAFDTCNTRAGGATIVYAKTTDSAKNDMYDVSVAYCRQGDTFCKKTGLHMALERYLEGQYITVKAKSKVNPWVEFNLREMFYHTVSDRH